MTTLHRYPLLLASGEIGYLYLPAYGVTHADAKRVRAMIDSLVIDVDPRPYTALCGFLSTMLESGVAARETVPAESIGV